MWQNAEVFNVEPGGKYSKHRTIETDNSSRKQQKQHRCINP